MSRFNKGLALVLMVMVFVVAILMVTYRQQKVGEGKTVSAKSEMSGYTLEVSDIKAVESWINKQPYTYARHKDKGASGEINGVEVVLSDDTEKAHVVGDGSGGTLQTGGFEYKKFANQIQVRVQIEPDHLDKIIVGNQRLFSQWVLTYLCMGADSYSGDFDYCWQEADHAIAKNSDGWFWLAKKTGWDFSLVKKAYAACGTSNCCSVGTSYNCGCDPLGASCIPEDGTCDIDCTTCTVNIVRETNDCVGDVDDCSPNSCSTGAYFPCSLCTAAPVPTPTPVPGGGGG
ncbi:MAG: hypothetical protein KKD28_06970 [Chloroflexi bacterium]|nr:hypothetical protein [Chloroflexota bacterium]MBU1661198.1 hypothetical protein [Chloroflexota bacterium]